MTQLARHYSTEGKGRPEKPRGNGIGGEDAYKNKNDNAGNWDKSKAFVATANAVVMTPPNATVLIRLSGQNG
ncbi:MAG: hypothetical protein M1813_003970 [Trichoglossum hirsutum]|nr:MAG: hypothetical protein M1813_003970 [Trichoglossum hirsutum]